MCSSIAASFSAGWRSFNPVMLLPALSFNSSVQLGPMRVREWFGQARWCPADCSRNGFSEQAGQSTLSAGRMRHFCRRLSPLTGQQPALSVCWASSVSSRTGRGSRTGRTGPVRPIAQLIGMLATGARRARHILPSSPARFGLASPPTG